MEAIPNYFNLATKLIRFQPYCMSNLGSIRLIKTMNQFKLNKTIKYPKRQMPTYCEHSLMEQRNNIHQTSALMGERKNYYHILGLKHDATLKEIKEAYYLLAKKYHPDSSLVFTSPVNAKMFQEISEAYRVLSDDSKRLEYDLYGVVKDIKKIVPSDKSNGDRKLHKIFDEAGYTRNSGDYDPPTLIEIPDEITVKVSFLQAIRGSSTNFTVKVKEKCPACTSSMAKSFKKNLALCPKCGGSGRQSITTEAKMVRGSCNECKGRRYVLQKACSDCKGQGIITTKKQIYLHIPPGTNSGEIIHVPHPSKKQTIAVRVLVANSDEFMRNGNDILSDLSITLPQALLGGVLKIKGVDGNDHHITLSPGTEANSKIRLVGKGIKTNTSVGDHILNVKVKLPKILTAKQRALMTAFAEIESDKSEVKAVLRKSKIKGDIANTHKLKSKTTPKRE